MISIKKQLIYVPFPFLNVIPLFIIVFINRKYITGVWQLRLLPYLAVAIALMIPIHLAMHHFLSAVLNERFLDFLSFYLYSLIGSIALLLFQKKNGIT